MRLNSHYPYSNKPITANKRVIGSKMVNLRSMLTDEILDQLVEVFKDWSTVFKAYPTQSLV